MNSAAAPHQRWVTVLTLFTATSVVESIGVSQLFAFMPLYLQQMGLPADQVPRWVGALSSLVFVFGLPLVPLWGVWADKYSRKAVIMRSAVGEAVMFGLIALSREPWQLAGSVALAGFQLGNSGVMLAAMREVTPARRLGTTIAVFGATWPIGSAVGPAIGSLMVDVFHTTLSAVFILAAVLSAGTALLLAFGLREVRPESPPTAPVLRLAYGAIRQVLTEPITRGIFVLFGVAILGRQVSAPFLPLLVQQVVGSGSGLASAIALVVGTAALVGGAVSPAAGVLGDKVGFRPVLAFSMAGSGLALLLMPFAPDLVLLAVANVGVSALGAAISAMVFGLLALEVPAESRSTTLNLVYLPLYVSGLIGPALGAGVVSAGLPAVFILSGALLVAAAPFAVKRFRLAG